MSIHTTAASNSDRSAPSLRVGLGFDTHRLGPGGPLRLGGIDIEAPVEALGHSDADVLLHAIVDSLLGAGRLGDIGRLFPDTAAENRDRDSADFLREAMRLVRSGGWQVVNLDSVILLQSPKLAPHLEAMSQRIAAIAELRPDQIGIKAKTGERVGPVGRREAIAARVVCLLWKAD